MTALTLKTAPSLMQTIVQSVFLNTPIHLGIITVGNNIADNLIETSPNNFRSIEYNSGSWTRPALTLSGAGNFNAGLDRWDFGSTSGWTVTGPPGGISIKQVVVILGGNSTPRDTTGITIGVGTYSVPLDIADGASQTIEMPWTIS